MPIGRSETDPVWCALTQCKKKEFFSLNPNASETLCPREQDQTNQSACKFFADSVKIHYTQAEILVFDTFYMIKLHLHFPARHWILNFTALL